MTQMGYAAQQRIWLACGVAFMRGVLVMIGRGHAKSLKVSLALGVLVQEGGLSKKFALISTVCASALLLCVTAASASVVTVSGTFNFLDNRSANSINLGAGVFKTFGAHAAAADGNDAGTTGTATQGIHGVTLNYEPFNVDPQHFVASRPAGSVPNGQWDLTFTNGSDTNATKKTPGLAGATLIPFVSAMSISGSGSAPTLSWTLPSGAPINAQSMTIRDTTDLIGQGGVGGGGVANVVYSQDITGATSFTIPTALNLDPTKLYSVELDLRQLRNTSGQNVLHNTLSESRSFFDFQLLPASAPANVFLPTVDTSNPALTVYQFTQIPTTDGTIFIDPAVAIGYDYQIGAGDPNFASVLLPTVGDNLFQLYLWDSTNSEWVDSHQVLKGGAPFDLTSIDSNGLDRFRILGIEMSALLDPNNATAFITGLTFMPGGNGTFSGTMTPITAETTPLPAALPLFASGLGGFGLLGWRRRKRKKAAVV